MHSFGIGEILLILALVLILFGAKRIPELARSFGKGISEFKKGLNTGMDREDEERVKKPRKKRG